MIRTMMLARRPVSLAGVSRSRDVIRSKVVQPDGGRLRELRRLSLTASAESASQALSNDALGVG
eukprot:3872763-Prymnesium_polylepis.1